MTRPENVTTTHLGEAAPGVERRGENGDSLPGVGALVGGKYRIDGLLGRGGMGVVVLGRQLELDRPVAIKFLRAPLAQDVRPLERFAREARIIARMRSDHVVRVFDVGREGDLPFIVMERLEGHDLSREIERAPLAVERAAELALHAAEALGEAHSLGIVHRDVKPSNLFVAVGLGGREVLKVLDFGVSKWLAPRDPDASSLSTEGGAIGTPAFASPEQLARPETIDARTDVWALGVVLYNALSGALPFRADTLPALYTAIITGDPAPFPRATGVPSALVTVIERCLRRDPDERYPSMLELARALVPFAPARAHTVVDSLAVLATAQRAAAPVTEPDPAESGLPTTLEFSQITPSQDSAARATGTQRQNVVLALGALGALGALVTAVFLLARPRTGELTEPLAASTAAPAATDVPMKRAEATGDATQAALESATPSVGPSARPSSSVATDRGAPVAVAMPARTSAAKRAAQAPGRAVSATPAPSASPPANTAPARASDTIPLYRH